MPPQGRGDDDRFPWAAGIATAAFAPIFLGLVLGYVPYLITAWEIKPPFAGAFSRWVGAVLIVIAIPPLLDFLLRFVREGRGTPAPFAPPRRLVVRGPFRRVRNPAYLCAVVIVVGEALVLGSVSLLVYAAFLALVFHLFVVLYEEPTLRGKFGAEYEAYCRAVPRWIPRPPGGRNAATRPSAPRSGARRP